MKESAVPAGLHRRFRVTCVFSVCEFSSTNKSQQSSYHNRTRHFAKQLVSQKGRIHCSLLSPWRVSVLSVLDKEPSTSHFSRNGAKKLPPSWPCSPAPHRCACLATLRSASLSFFLNPRESTALKTKLRFVSIPFDDPTWSSSCWNLSFSRTSIPFVHSPMFCEML